jgi:hypothetical protein
MYVVFIVDQYVLFEHILIFYVCCLHLRKLHDFPRELRNKWDMWFNNSEDVDVRLLGSNTMWTSV